MIKKYYYWIFCLLVVLVVCIGCGDRASQQGAATGKQKKIMVTVSIMPQLYFVQRIAGDKAQVNVLVPSSQSPDTYEPTPRQMQELSQSQLYFRVGPLVFETVWLGNIAANNPHLKVIDTSVGTPLLKYPDQEYEITENAMVDGQNRETHEHHHDHNSIDPHTWVSPTAVKTQIGHIKDAFIALDPVNRPFYEEHYTQFLREIERLHFNFTKLFSNTTQRKFMVFHPAWGYFARDYNLQQLSIEVAGKTPGPATLKQVIDIARKENIRFIIVQQQADTHNAAAVAADINGDVVFLDPLEINWLANMQKIATTLGEILNNSLKPTPK